MRGESEFLLTSRRGFRSCQPRRRFGAALQARLRDARCAGAGVARLYWTNGGRRKMSGCQAAMAISSNPAITLLRIKFEHCAIQIRKLGDTLGRHATSSHRHTVLS
jgi:hypothetical protein